MVFSRATFGPGARTKGVTDHIRKELVEVANSDGSPDEWTDVAILALDGLTRSIWAAHPGWTAQAVAEKAVNLIVGKQGKNELRNWPDWRSADPTKAIEHERGHHD
jgi:hypothetical protein